MRTLALGDGVRGRRVRLTEDEALRMELALNTSRYRHEWSDVGDCLYDFHTRRTDARVLTVTATQLRALRRMMGSSPGIRPRATRRTRRTSSAKRHCLRIGDTACPRRVDGMALLKAGVKMCRQG